jgi:KTSC domain
MRRHHVDSSAVRSVGYDEDRHELEIEYAEGGVYRYSLVPRRSYEELLAAPSIGAYVATQVKPRYPVSEVE